MVKSLNESYNSQNNTIKIPSIVTFGNNGNKIIKVSSYGDLTKKLLNLDLTIQEKNNTNSDRETFIIQEDQTKNFYFATLEQKPGFSWVIGLIDYIKTRKKEAEGNFGNVFFIQNIDQSFLSKICEDLGFTTSQDLVSYLKEVYDPTCNLEYHYKAHATFQMLAMFYKKDNKLHFLGTVLNNLTTARSMYCKNNPEVSCISFLPSRAYKANLKNVGIKGKVFTYLDKIESEKIPDDILSEVEEDWDKFFDYYVEWQTSLVNYFKTILLNHKQARNKTANSIKTNPINVEKTLNDDNLDDEIPF